MKKGLPEHQAGAIEKLNRISEWTEIVKHELTLNPKNRIDDFVFDHNGIYVTIERPMPEGLKSSLFIEVDVK